MENIEKNLSIIKSLETDIINKVSAKADKIFQESMEERQLRMKTVDADKAFDELLKKPEILNVFIRLRDK
ncbi:MULTISPECIES: hypothetical protein [Snodgrassella]|uniref:hypothetical protein n=1 Tax=Snodgrassella TaxID=1193515 RepID=UPI000A0093BD|nr:MULTISPECIES: hypothetical protein [Snodgrassella]MBI0159404.1 hypothetical protein [Snodgrassella sp. W6238H11]MBI0161428.1 hypothetical protein [Snodgrassella sp. W6238H14]NUE80083.1 hypothetical protein [Snodgrassella sp. ESL0304]ORF33825.1 hypothetical protein BGI09_01625 [Snodgrassella alvi]